MRFSFSRQPDEDRSAYNSRALWGIRADKMAKRAHDGEIKKNRRSAPGDALKSLGSLEVRGPTAHGQKKSETRNPNLA
jgi:hypothetical protein